jgi:hypothetical protein
MKYIVGILGVVLVLSSMSAHRAQAASDTATANCTVVAAIGIAQVSNLEFGTDSAGAVAKTVAPGTADNAENASFAITGEPSTAYTITLPSDGTVVMGNGGTGANNEIAVNSFASFPATTGTLDGTGAQTLLVGATRAALGGAQNSGSYSATFTVDVVY